MHARVERTAPMRNLVRTVVAMVALLMLAGVAAPTAAAAMDGKCPHRFGAAQQITDAGGAVAQQWTVTDLRPSTDSAPGYPLAGQLWEATVSVHALSGSVTPIIPNVYAVAHPGMRYQVLWQVASPGGLPAATIDQGQTSTGKVYFDVTGADPMAVIYANGGTKPAMMWCCSGDMSMPMSMPMRDCPGCAGMSMPECPGCEGGQPCPGCAGMR